MKRIGRATAVEMAATGIRWDFGPVRGRAAGRPLGPDLRGLRRGPAGRSPTLGEAFIRGLQGANLTADRPPRPRPPSTSSATAARPGAPRPTTGYPIDQGVTDVDEATLRAIHLAPYQDRDRCGRPHRHGLFLEHGRRQGPRRPPPADRGPQGRARVHRASSCPTGAASTRSIPTTTPRSRRRSPPASTWSWSRTTPAAVPGRGPGRAGRRDHRAGPDRRRGDAHPARQVRAGPVRAPDAAAEDTPRTSVPPRTGSWRGRRSAASAVLLKTAAGVLPLATDAGRVLLAGLRRGRHRHSSRAAGPSRGRVGRGADRRPARPSPTPCEPGWATGSLRGSCGQFPAGTRAEDRASWSSPSRPTPRARATRRRWPLPRADLDVVAPGPAAGRPAGRGHPLRPARHARSRPAGRRRGGRRLAARHRRRGRRRRPARRRAVHGHDPVHLAEDARRRAADGQGRLRRARSSRSATASTPPGRLLRPGGLLDALTRSLPDRAPAHLAGAGLRSRRQPGGEGAGPDGGQRLVRGVPGSPDAGRAVEEQVERSHRSSPRASGGASAG